jgi:hypothetical protein
MGARRQKVDLLPTLCLPNKLVKQQAAPSGAGVRLPVDGGSRSERCRPFSDGDEALAMPCGTSLNDGRQPDAPSSANVTRPTR